MTQNDIDVDALWEKHSLHIDEGTQIMTYPDFERALTEALAGRWSDEDMFRAFMRRTPKSLIAEGLTKSFQDRDDFNKWLKRFKSERGI